ncbi:MAG: glutamate-cysteine ligase family protein [Rhodospirillaceae bacterium]
MTTEAASHVGARRRARDIGAFDAYGLELEYMLVSEDTLDVLPIADAALELAGAAPGRGDVEHGTLGWSNELVRHVIELKNVEPCSLAELTGRFQPEIARFNAVLAARGGRLMPGGMHPWMDPAVETQLWPHGNAAVYQAYDRIFGCRAHGWANLQSSHINLPFAGDDEFARLHAAVRAVLPIIPALAASSPYAEGRAPGPLDYRMVVYRANSQRVPSLTGAVVPATMTSRREYEDQLLGPMYRDIAPFDPAGVLQHEWLNSHGAIARFSRNAIEIRVMDAQECPLADVALAALIVDVVQALYTDHYAPLAQLQSLPTSMLSRVLDACIAQAEGAYIAEPEYLRVFGAPRSGMEARALWCRIAEDLEATGAQHHGLWAGPAHFVFTRGTLARRLIDVLGPQPERAAMRAVYRELATCLAAGRMFDP